MEKFNLTQTGPEVQEILNQSATKGDVLEEKERAEGAEQLLQKGIDDEETRAKGAEQTLQQNIDAEETRAKGVEQNIQLAIEGILALIPSAASTLNQLADKSFVNSSISTATATFRGTYNLVTDLSLTPSATHSEIATALLTAVSVAENNDYAFVQIPTSSETPTEIAKTERYKFNGTSWEYEYDLNNSGYTSDQWAAINSGITALLVQKLVALPTALELAAALAAKQDALTFDSAPTQDSNNPVKSGGIYTAIKDEETRAKGVEQNIQQAIEGILALIPSAASALNQLADKAFVNSSISTATATFRGTFNLVTDLNLSVAATHSEVATALASAIATADNNDYCFVQVPTAVVTPTEIERTDRYKFNGEAWAYEYTLNNSGFTSAQWAAINSGITALLVQKLIDLPTAAELATSVAAKANASEMTITQGTGGNAGKTTIQLKSGTSATVLTDTLINVTYADLVTLRNGGNLVKGQFYRITDFVTTVNSSLTEVRSAGHAFDLIVQALDVDVLSEDARAIQHDGDTYFANSKLEAWLLKYNLDNDTTRFEWADSTNGKGVIWRMVDEFENDIPYDFKNIQYKMYKVTDSHPSRTSLNGKYLGFKDGLVTTMQLTIEDNTDFIWAYTFSSDATGGSQSDKSMSTDTNLNHIAKGFYIVFFVQAAGGCYNVEIGEAKHFVSLSLNQTENVSINFAHYVVVCEMQVFSAVTMLYVSSGGVVRSKFGTVQEVSFGDGCRQNSIFFLAGNSGNVFGNNFKYNTICYGQNLTLGDNAQMNFFAGFCSNIVAGNNLNGCYFGSLVRYITINKDFVDGLIVESHNRGITITSTQTTSASNLLTGIKICENTHFDQNNPITISHDTVNDTFETEYKPQNSQTVFV